jgi:serine/threonine-protein kinase
MREVAEIFADALELPPGERDAFLERECGENRTLLAQVRALLAGHDAAATFLETPAVERPAGSVEEQIGEWIGDYQLESKLGDGGCGVVYRARQVRPVRRAVALKVIKLGMDTRQVIARFEAERQALALMDHPDIARVFDAGMTARGRPFFVMELVEGVPVTEFADHAGLTLRERLDLVARICFAVQHAHQKGIIHRDLKPSNILVARHEGTIAPKIIDFGVAKAMHENLTEATLVTRFDQVIGTPAYMSPEQLNQETHAIDTRTDVYALGCLLYEIAVGTHPFPFEEIASRGQDALRKTVQEVVPHRPSLRFGELSEPERARIASSRQSSIAALQGELRGDLDWIITRCLEKEPDRRYASARDLADDIQRLLRREPIEARPPSRRYLLQKFVSRHRFAVASVAALSLTLLLGTVVSTWQAVRARTAEQLAEQERDVAKAATAAESLAREAAERRQEQAEDLLTFMLGDFRSELSEIGRLSLLDAVGEKAMAYFESLHAEDLTDTTLARQVKAITQIGEIRIERANYAEASAAFATALSRAQALVSRYPENPDFIFERAQVEYWIGYAELRQEKMVAAGRWMTAYRDSTLQLLELEGPTFRARSEVAYGLHNLAAIDSENERFSEARQGYEKEREMLLDLFADFPDDKGLLHRLGSVANWQALDTQNQGHFSASERYATEALERYQALSRMDPDSPDWRQQAARAIHAIGTVAFLLGRWDEAKDSFEQTLELFRRRATEDPENLQNFTEVMWTHLSLAELALAHPETAADAIPHLEVARQGFAELVAAEANGLTFHRGLARTWRLEALLQDLEGRSRSESINALGKALSIVSPILEDFPDERWNIFETSHTLIHLGRLARREGDADAAAQHWSQALRSLPANAMELKDWRILATVVELYRLLGRSEEAATAIAYLDAAGYVPANPLTRAEW